MINFTDVRERAGYKVSSAENDAIVASTALGGERDPTLSPNPAKHFDGFDVERATKQFRESMDAVIQDFPNVKDDTVLSFLLDSRGGMRGWPIVAFAGMTGWLTRELDALGLKHEILSHTTKEWKASAAGSDRPPGRVGSLLHVIWKKTDSVAPDISLEMLKWGNNGVLKDNVDGEAVEWAYSRIAARPEPHKLLFTVKSGSLDPMSQATELYNGSDPHVLHRHLLSTVNAIKDEGDVRISAVILDKYKSTSLFHEDTGISDNDVIDAYDSIHSSATHDWDEMTGVLTDAISSSMRRSLELEAARTPSV
jgi:hypothetical protein